MLEELMDYLFSEAGEEDVALATPSFELLNADYATRIITEGDTLTTGLFILVDGDVEVVRENVLLATLHSGAMMGELCLFGHEQRTASVIASTPVSLLALDRPALLKLQREGNRVAWVLEVRAMTTVVNRIRDTQLRIAQLAERRGQDHHAPSAGFFQQIFEALGLVGRRAGGHSQRVKLLQQLPHFSDVEEDAIHELASAMSATRFSEGSVICREGDGANEVFLIVDGTVSVQAGTADHVATLPAGEFFGVSSMLEHHPRNATCVAHSDATILRLSRSHWQDFAQEHSTAASSLRSAMLLTLAHQLERANKHLAQVDKALREEMGAARETPAPTQRIHDLIWKG